MSAMGAHWLFLSALLFASLFSFPGRGESGFGIPSDFGGASKSQSPDIWGWMGPPQNQKGDFGYSRATDQQVWSSRMCFFTIVDSVKKEQENCSNRLQEFACREKPHCLWQAGKQECWSLALLKCFESLHSRCNEIHLVRNFSWDSQGAKRFRCEMHSEQIATIAVD